MKIAVLDDWQDTVRTLAGFVSTCGLVDKNKVTPMDFRGLKKAVDAAYGAYRKCYRPRLWRLPIAWATCPRPIAAPRMT